jgi:L-2,4-diaminobutyric acid acetyltransferase
VIVSKINELERLTYFIDMPTVDDALQIHQLIQASPPLDLNSEYAYLLQASHFSATCRVARLTEHPSQIAAYVSGYALPGQPDILFIWQVAVSPTHRGQGLAIALLENLVYNQEQPLFRALQTTISPDNVASIALFTRLAKRTKSDINKQIFFSTALFGSSDHAAEDLYTVGTFQQKFASI